MAPSPCLTLLQILSFYTLSFVCFFQILGYRQPQPATAERALHTCTLVTGTPNLRYRHHESHLPRQGTSNCGKGDWIGIKKRITPNCLLSHDAVGTIILVSSPRAFSFHLLAAYLLYSISARVVKPQTKSQWHIRHYIGRLLPHSQVL